MDSENEFSKIRQEFKLRELTREELGNNPIIALKKWLNEAIESKVAEPTAMLLASADDKGHPSCRVVLLKEVKPECICFFTNYNSRKSQDFEKNNNVAATFFWPNMERQIRIEGIIKKSDPDISDIYFSSRPYESQIGAWASPQSEVIENRDFLENNYKSFEKKYLNPDRVPRPPFWGGYKILPNYFEFWQGRPGRLHDRIQFKKMNNEWDINRLAP